MASWRNYFLDIYLIVRAIIQGYYHLYFEIRSSIRPLEDPLTRKNEYAVITGGNRGIGWETAKILAESGMKVIIGCRDGPSREQLFKSIQEAKLPSGSIEWINLDMSSMDSVRSFAQAILDKDVPISLLINNAGKGSSPYSETADGFESLFATNYLGHFLLAHLLMPRLLAAGKPGQSARIVNVSSKAQALGWFNINDLQSKSFYNPMYAYSRSKLALIMFTKILDEHLSRNNKSVKPYAVHPGIIYTSIWDSYWLTHYVYRATGFLFKAS
ncbi:dehydrogenase/reductase SDR family member on chromosome X-like isoform X1 [Daphnia carinata]|uniref:dehydrogenase/reductase SDR family member on chromosome X-like isoform X1 n=1 Tax=Daphnia carinata TaxID=120202 RepID=UPI00286846B8|nr:dehydrogenase/reductase SDR family member on chromosome X-like isoform X1 [Daphnia carinata]